MTHAPVGSAITAAVPLGATALRVSPLGLGTWSWGDRKFWGYEKDFHPTDVVDAFVASVEAGVTLFDTAEVYGHGESEQILGYLLRKSGAPAVVASKFAPLRGRDGARAVAPALENTLKRLKLPRVDLYQVHWADHDVASVEDVMDALADLVASGRVGAVGVSNYTAAETRRAHAALAHRGLPLASNQVHYSLLHRAPEADGVLDACRELGVALLAYSPLEQGILTGKYHDGTRVPEGRRGEAEAFSPANMLAASAVVGLLREVGAAHGGRAPEQVALNWLMRQPGVVPLAGAKTGEQARRNAGALGWSLAPDEVAAIARATEAWRRG